MTEGNLRPARPVHPGGAGGPRLLGITRSTIIIGSGGACPHLRAKVDWDGLAGEISKDGTLQKEEGAPPDEQRFSTMNAKANTAPPRILLVGLPYGLPDTDQDEFYTDKHFLDYDIVIFDPQGALKGRSHDYTINIHDDVLSLGPNVGDAFHKGYAGTTEKLVRFVNKGAPPALPLSYHGWSPDVAKQWPGHDP